MQPPAPGEIWSTTLLSSPTPRTRITLDRNSRGVNICVEYRADDPDEALRTAQRLFDALAQSYRPEGGTHALDHGDPGHEDRSAL